MAYASGNKILDDHYNIFVTGNANGAGDINIANVNTVWGAGGVDKGYGQTGTLPAVSTGVTITATQWANLISRINTLGSHQGTSIQAMTVPTAGTQIQAIATMQTNINAIYNSRRNAASSGASTSATRTETVGWTDYSYMRLVVNFGSATKMRYFFNAGGRLAFTASRSGGTNHAKNAEWTDLLSKLGTLVFTNGSGDATIAGTTYTGFNKIGGGGVVDSINTTYGFFDVPFNNTWTRVLRQFADTTPYTANYADFYVKGNSDGFTMEFAVNLIDASADNTAGDVVDGTLQAIVTAHRPSTNYLVDTWGTPVLSSYSDGHT